MPRNANPAPVHFHQGLPVSGGRMFYFESGTNTIKTTFDDAEEKTENPHPVNLDAAGREPNIFFSGSAKQILRTSLTPPSGQGADELVFERDPVGGQSQLGNFSDYSGKVIYNIPDLVRTSDDRFFESLEDANEDNNPLTDGGINWKEIDFVNPVWAIGATYKKTDMVTGTDKNRYESLIDLNKGNDPVTGDSTKWKNLSGWEKTATSSFTTSPGLKVQVEATSAPIDITMPSTLAEGQEFIAHNSSASTFKVQILNPNFTIRGKASTIVAGTDLEIQPGETAALVAINPTTLEVV